ncbi:MAG: PilZ domain-containing protein [Firmicutes bacterium]|nr:PilZ domain-containing protein [Bacillota bacterium]
MRKFEHCKKADILNEKNEPIATADVGIDSSNRLRLTFTDFDPTKSEEFNVLFYDPSEGLVTCLCRFSQPEVIDKKLIMTCHVIQRLAQEQRRRDLKVNLKHDVYIQLMGRGGGEFHADIVNFSAGGVLLRSKLFAGPGDKLFFSFREAGDNIPMIAEILRVEPPKSNEEPLIYGYGCRFLGLTAQQEEMLRGFVFRQEMEKRKNN